MTVTAAIIQARMGSRRLPGKVLLPVAGKPVLYYQVQQIRAAQSVDNLIIATSTNPTDDPIAAFCKEYDLDVSRGSEENVLERFYGAARQIGADLILRMTGDCPLIDPQAIDSAVKVYRTNLCDYLYLGLTFAEGICCDLFTFGMLEAAFQEASLADEKEHITPFFHKRPQRFRIKALENSVDDSHYRIVVDEPQDFDAVKMIIQELWTEGTDHLEFGRIKDYLDRHPEIKNINSNIIRNESYDFTKITKVTE